MTWYEGKKGGGGEDIKEVFFSSRISGAGSHYMYISPDGTTYNTNNQTIIASGSEYFTADANYLTAIKPVKVRSTVNNTSEVLNLAIGDTVRYYNGGAFNIYIITVLG